MNVDLGVNRKEVSRIVQVGHSLYALLTGPIASAAGLKKGDRLAMETDGRTVYLTRIPFEDLIPHPRRRRDGSETK